MLGNIFVNIRRAQKEAYNFELVPSVIEFINNMHPLNEEDMWELSRKLEAPTHESTDKLNPIIIHNHANTTATVDALQVI